MDTQSRKHSSRKPRPAPASYAPGGGGFGIMSIGSAAGGQNCPGCVHHCKPEKICAACSQPAARALRADDHWLPLCLACLGIIKQIRAESQEERAAVSRANLEKARQHKTTTGKAGAA
jgi:hypothetical protein